MHIPDKFHCCVMETFFVVDIALFSVQLPYGDANHCSTSSAHKSCSTLLPYEYTSGKQNRRQIALFLYLGCFWFSFSKGYIVKKRRHYSAGGTALHMFH